MNKNILKKAVTISIIVLLIISMQGCVKKEQIKPETILDYMPLSVGNTWVYEGEGNEYASYTQKIEYIDGDKYQISVNNGGTISAHVLAVKSDEARLVFHQGENYDNKNFLKENANADVLVFKYPVVLGAKWNSANVDFEIISTSSKLTVPAGTFSDCTAIQISYQGSNSKTIYYLKKGIGIVEVEFSTNDGYKVYSRLKSYSFK